MRLHISQFCPDIVALHGVCGTLLPVNCVMHIRVAPHDHSAPPPPQSPTPFFLGRADMMLEIWKFRSGLHSAVWVVLSLSLFSLAVPAVIGHNAKIQKMLQFQAMAHSSTGFPSGTAQNIRLQARRCCFDDTQD